MVHGKVIYLQPTTSDSMDVPRSGGIKLVKEGRFLAAPDRCPVRYTFDVKGNCRRTLR